MILDFYIEFENWEEHIEELEEELLKKSEEIKEDLSIKIYMSVLVNGEYENFEIEYYLEDNAPKEDVEIAIDRVITSVENKYRIFSSQAA